MNVLEVRLRYKQMIPYFLHECKCIFHKSRVLMLNMISLASAEAQGNVVRAICISKGKAHF
jgi:hypothetical protein